MKISTNRKRRFRKARQRSEEILVYGLMYASSYLILIVLFMIIFSVMKRNIKYHHCIQG